MLNKPAFITTSKINILGTPAKRLMVVYRAKGCSKAAMGDPCTMCGFLTYANKNIGPKEILNQHKHSINLLKKFKYEHFDMLTLGNFFNDREILPALRDLLLGDLSRIKHLKRILVESRREYVTMAKLTKAKNMLRKDQRLVLGLGYESHNASIRNKVLKKDVSEKDVDQIIQLCKGAGLDFCAYTLIKPPTLTEKEAIIEAAKSAVHILKKAKSAGVNAYIAFEPVFIPFDSELNRLFLSKEYHPPMLWSIIETLNRTAKLLGKKNVGGKLFVGISDEDLSGGRTSTNNCSCDKNIISAIQAFNGHQDVSILSKVDHKCKDKWFELINEKR